MKKRHVILLLPFLLGSCSKEEISSTPEKPGVIILKEQSKSSLLVGDTYQIEGEIQSEYEDSLLFASLTKEVLSVDESGLVTALKKGTGRIQISSKRNPETSAILSFQVYDRISDSFPALGQFLDTFTQADESQGYDIDMSFLVDLGKIKANIMNLIETTILDLSYDENPDSDKRFCLDMSFFHQKKDEDFYQASIYLENALSKVLKNNTLLNTIFKNTDLRGTLYSGLFSSFNISYGDYLSQDDFAKLDTMNLYSYGLSDIYSTLERKEGESIIPFAFGKDNILSLLSPYIDDLLPLIKEKDTSSLPTKDDLSLIEGMMANYLTEKKTGDSVTYSLKSDIVKIIDQKYQQILPNHEISKEVQSTEVKISFPEKITGLYLSIDNTFYEGKSKAKLVLQGKRSQTEEAYPFLELDISKPVMSDNASSKDRADRFQAYLNASQPSSSIDDTAQVSPVSLIKEADQIYIAEKDYQASGDKFQAKKNELLGYYFSNGISEEKRNLLYPMYERIKSLDYSNQDYAFSYAEKSEVGDDETIPFGLNHLYQGKNLNDFSSTYESSNEDIIDVDAFGNVSGVKGIYNGNVKDDNTKSADVEATITATMNQNGQDTFKKDLSFTKTFTYTGKERAFPTTLSSFKESASFNKETRELTLDENSQFQLKSILNLPSSLTNITFSSSDDKLVSTTLLSLSDTINVHSIYENSKKVQRDLCGIKATVRYMDGLTPKKETLVFYIRVRKA